MSTASLMAKPRLPGQSGSLASIQSLQSVMCPQRILCVPVSHSGELAPSVDPRRRSDGALRNMQSREYGEWATEITLRRHPPPPSVFPPSPSCLTPPRRRLRSSGSGSHSGPRPARKDRRRHKSAFSSRRRSPGNRSGARPLPRFSAPCGVRSAPGESTVRSRLNSPGRTNLPRISHAIESCACTTSPLSRHSSLVRAVSAFPESSHIELPTAVFRFDQLILSEQPIDHRPTRVCPH